MEIKWILEELARSTANEIANAVLELRPFTHGAPDVESPGIAMCWDGGCARPHRPDP